MQHLNRRQFLKHSSAATAAVAAFGSTNVLGANERVAVGVMGTGGRGTQMTLKFAERKDVEIAYVADADLRRANSARTAVEKATDRAPKAVQDFRRVLEDKTVDVLLNATPDHWHALGTILACQAGKDVYVEKPMAHNIWEGRQMIEAARKYQRVIQVGMQTRSADYAQKAAEIVRSGRLGSIHLVRVFNVMQHGMAKDTAQPIPAEVDADLWSGPAAKAATWQGHRWLNLYEYSCGPIPGDAIHQLDFARMVMGNPPAPKSVSATGALRVLRDGRDTPDTQLATYDYEGFTLQFDGALWTPYMTKTPMNQRDKDLIPNWPFNSTRIELLGTKGFMYVGRHGDGWQLFDENAKLVETSPGRQGDALHIENFLQCVRSRGQPVSNAEQGHQSVLLSHLANIACRTGNRTLAFDAPTESFPGVPEAKQFLKRPSYRAPWLVPEKV